MYKTKRTRNPQILHNKRAPSAFCLFTGLRRKAWLHLALHNRPVLIITWACLSQDPEVAVRFRISLDLNSKDMIGTGCLWRMDVMTDSTGDRCRKRLWIRSC